MNSDLDAFRAFAAVAELGSFHEAALLLNLSQPALSRRVQKLEASLGVDLLKRTTRRVELTAVGRDFLPRVQRLIDEFERSLLSVREVAERRGGQVGIACAPSATLHFLPDVIRVFAECYPQIRIRILDEIASTVIESVLAGDVDLGIAPMTAPDSRLTFDRLLDDPFVLACCGDHPLAMRQEVEWRDLAPYRFITVGRLTANRLVLDHGLAEADWRPRWSLEVRRVATAVGLVAAGLGVAALPRLAVERGDGAAGLIIRPLVNPVLRRTIGIIRRRDATPSPSAERFYEMLKSRWTGTSETA